MERDYKINKRNSTVCGYPGRDFDWDKFCWDGSSVYQNHFTRGVVSERKAPLPFVDDGLIAPNCEYLHVPYNWEEDCTIYRVRPNESMRAGERYRGYAIAYQKAVQKKDGWYWSLVFVSPPKE